MYVGQIMQQHSFVTCIPPIMSIVGFRSAIPVCTATLAIFIEKKVPTGEEALGLIVLTLGVMVAVWEGSVSGSVTGLILCCAGTVCNAAMMSTAGKVMSEKVDVLRLTFYTAPVSCAVLLPLFLIREVSTQHLLLPVIVNRQIACSKLLLVPACLVWHAPLLLPPIHINRIFHAKVMKLA